jgi:hypothetical protein
MAKRTIETTEGNCVWNKDLCQVTVRLTQSTFDVVKTSAIFHNRSLSSEIRTMVEAAVTASKKLDG